MKRFLIHGLPDGAGSCLAALAATGRRERAPRKAPAKHVLLLSVDGLHQSDLAWYVRAPPALGAGAPRAQGRRVHARADAVPVRLVPGHGRPGDRRQPEDDRRLLRRLVEPRAAAGGHDDVRRRRRPGVEVTYFEQLDQNPLALDAGQGLPGLPGRDPGDDRQPDDADRSGAAAGRSGDLQAGLPALLPQGEHDLRGRPRRGHAHRVVGQAPRLRDPQRAVGHRHPGPLHARDQQRGADARRRRTTGRPTTR